MAKYDNEAIPEGFRSQSGQTYTHATLFWVSVVYLNYAEACAELGNFPQDDLDQSIQLLKDRAGLQQL
ncbi:RagB/SusD family nutrient uptake outer membrane protein, partial [Bacteroides fragilis]|uniref:RagB/SusD family nutrient uptake outer membrane protein n=1 Tax=Bacteroides fragilis TaxID=817 RepID=UPI001F4DD023